MSGEGAQGAEGPGPAKKKMVGNFEVLEEIGRGAMGAVFKARQVSVDRIVALKVLPPRLAKDEKFIGRFLREARAAAHLNHPNIVQAIDAGHAKPYYYFAMEFVDGPSADALLESEGPLRERRALEIARDIARALDHAHQADIVHRDVKPDNILIAADGTAKLADLGLARETVDLDSRLTQAGMAVGTPDYISPEQARGEDELDGRTDVYSLGATLYHLVTGSPPYTGKSAVDIMYKHLHDPPPDPRAVNPQVSAGMAAIVSKAMAKRRQQRYANAEALLNDLERLLAMKRTTVASVGPRITGRIVSQRTVDTPIPRHRRRKSRTGLYVGIAAAVVALVVLGILLVPKGEKEPEAKGPGPVVQTPTTEPAVATLSDQKRTLARVRGWVKAHPGEYREGIQKYEWLIPKLTDLEVKMDAEEALAALNEARASAANAAGVRLSGQANTLAEAGDYDGAVAVYDKLPETFADLLSARAKDAADQLKTKAETSIRRVMAAAEKLCDEGEPLKGIAELDKVKHIKYAALSSELVKLRERLDAESKNVEALKQKRAVTAAKKAVDKLLEDIEAAALRGDLAEAARLADAAAGGDKYKLAADRLAPVVAVGRALGKAAAFQKADPVEALRQLLGQETTLRSKKQGSVKGKVTEVTAAKVVLVKTYTMMGAERTRRYEIPISDLTPETVERLKPKWVPKMPDEHLAAAMLAYAANDPAKLEVALGKAAGHPLHARYSEKLTELRMGAAAYAAKLKEDAAKKAWEEKLLPLIDKANRTKAETEALLKLLDAFEQKYGTTDFAAARKTEIASVRDASVKGGAEAAAEAVWKQLERLAARSSLTESQAKAAIKSLDDFGEKYGATRYAATVEKDVPALRRKFEDHLPKLRFDSKLPLVVFAVDYAELGWDWLPRHLGRTPTADGKGIGIPVGTTWGIRPADPKNLRDGDLKLLAAEIRRHAIRGLCLGGDWHLQGVEVTDAGLAHLRGLSSLQYLDLARCRQITGPGLAFLKGLTRLRALRLRQCEKIGDEGLAQVRGLKELICLDVSGCGVTDAGLGPLAALTKLRLLNIGSNGGVSNAGLQHLRGLRDLELLGLGYTRVTGTGLARIAALTRMKELLLPARISGRGIRHLRQMTGLESLAMDSSGEANPAQINDEDLAFISSFRRLRRLWLGHAVRVTDAGLAHIGRLQRLETLKLAGYHKITDAGLAHLGGLKRLEKLVVSKCGQLTDAGLAHLEGTSLTSFYCDKTKITAAGKKAVLEGIKKRRAAMAPLEGAAKKDWEKIQTYASRTTLTKTQARTLAKALDTFDEKYGATAFAATVADDIAALRERIAPHLPVWRFKSRLRLIVGMYAKPVEPWAPSFRRLGSTPTPDGKGVPVPVGAVVIVMRPDPKTFTDRDLRAVAAEIKRKSIRGLCLNSCSQITDAGLAHLKACPKLRYLDLTGCTGITDVALAHLKGLTQLEHLDLKYCGRVTDAGVAHLKGLTELTYLDLNAKSFPGKITDAGLAHLAGLTKLKSLRLAFNRRITGAGLAHLKRLADLEQLNLHSCQWMRDGDLAHLGEMGKLKRLTLNQLPRLTDAGLAHLSGMKLLESLALAKCGGIGDVGLEHLSGLRTLKELDVRGTKVTDRGVKELQKAIPGLKITR